MAATSIPKARLVSLIIDGLGAGPEARAHFHVGKEDRLPARLMSFGKPDLLTFILSLGTKAETALRNLQTEFPLRRPPTCYVTILNSLPTLEALLKTSRTLLRKPAENDYFVGADTPIRRLSLSQLPQSYVLKGQKVLAFELQYDRRVEIRQAEPHAEDYGEVLWIYSLESAFVWLPTTRHQHAVVVCCDYPAVRHIFGFLSRRLGLTLSVLSPNGR